MTYYCFQCRATLGYSRDLPSGALLVTDYQRQKHEKHSVVSTSERLQSIFADPSTSAIRRYVEDALLSGPMEIDDQNRVSFYSTSTGTVGYRYERGTLVEFEDATKVVFSTSPERHHAFPENTARLSPDVTKTQASSHFEIEKGLPLWLKGSATNLPLPQRKATGRETKQNRFGGASQ